VENYASNERCSQAARGGSKYDLITLEYTIEALVKAGNSRCSTWIDPNIKNSTRNTPDAARSGGHTPCPGGRTVGIVVNTAKIKDRSRATRMCSNGTHKKRIVILNDAREIVTWALNTAGLPINDISRKPSRR